MKQVKFGAIFMISIMGLAAIGVSYAHWEETLYIRGFMYTDDIDPAFITAISNDPSGVGFMPDPWECGVWDRPSEDIDGWHGARKLKNVGSTDVDILPGLQGEEDHLLRITIQDAYPCYYTHPYFEIANYGSVPVNLYSYRITRFSFDEDITDGINPVIVDRNVDLMQAGTIYYIRWIVNAAGDLVPQVATNVNNPDNWDFSIERTDFYEMGTQLDPWRWGHNDGYLLGDHINPDDYTDKLYGDLCIHFLNSCEQLALYDFQIELVFWNWPEGGEGCDNEYGIGCNGDLMLCLDSSGSIDEDNRILATTAAQGFANTLMLDNAQIGVVNFSNNAILQQPLTNVLGDILTGIANSYSGYDPTWGTNLHDGLVLCHDELTNHDRDDMDYPDYIVIITDGLYNIGGDPQPVADAAKADDITIFVIGIGGVDQTYCENLASSPDHYFPAADWTVLQDILEGLINCPQ
jgi:uncharacterized protein YegL